ncbi:MAG: hypothetical protein ABGZ36_01090 [Actinomycetota bacterium]
MNRDRLERIRSDLAALRAAADIEDATPPAPAPVNGATRDGEPTEPATVEARVACRAHPASLHRP